MLNQILFLFCLQANPVYQQQCKFALHAFSIQTGLQVYSDLSDKYARDKAIRTVNSLNIDPVFTDSAGILYQVLQFGMGNQVSVPIPYHPFSDAFSIYGSKYNLGVELTWNY